MQDHSSTFKNLKSSLSRRLKKSQKKFQKNHPKAYEFLMEKEIQLGTIREHAQKTAASAALASAIILATPAVNQIVTPITVKHAELSQFERESLFSSDVMKHVTPGTYSLTPEQEEEISTIIHDYWDISAYPVLESKRLNHAFGLMGGEQHMPRFPGDTVYQHDELQKAGITPARGAWGYFAKSKAEMTPELVQKEKYYVAVQTLYLPDWNSNWVELKEWYKFRKVVVVNPHNGRTVVAVIGDAGPAKWTGKHFGGSPEVMQHLELYKGPMKGEVVLFFVDDPDDTIPLGPVGYQ